MVKFASRLLLIQQKSENISQNLMINYKVYSTQPTQRKSARMQINVNK